VLPQVSEFRLLQTVSARGCHPNVLIVCEDRVVDAVIARATRWSPRPLHRCAPDEWQLPEQAGGTLLLKDPSGLTGAQQAALFDWMSAGGRGTQVVSISRACLQARVRDGAFLEALFFRLNVLQIEINCRQPVALPG